MASISKSANIIMLIGTFMITTVSMGVQITCAEAASTADFYKGKKITFIVSQPAGGYRFNYSHFSTPSQEIYRG